MTVGKLIYFGELMDAATPDWRGPRESLANLVHNATIRSDLRDAISSR